MAFSLSLVAKRSVRSSALSGYGLDEKNCSRVFFAAFEIFVRLDTFLTELTELVGPFVFRGLCVNSGVCSRNIDESCALPIGGSS
jgi:hypothetical protein